MFKCVICMTFNTNKKIRSKKEGKKEGKSRNNSHNKPSFLGSVVNQAVVVI